MMCIGSGGEEPSRPTTLPAMPQVSCDIRIPVSPSVAFAVSQTHGDARRRWDPFIREQRFLDGAEQPAVAVRTFTRTAFAGPLSPTMISRYVSWRPPTSVGMTMERGPWFFERFGAGWRFSADPEGTHASWKYTFTIRPAWLRPLAEPLGRWILGREIRARIRAFAAACEDETVLASLPETDED